MATGSLVNGSASHHDLVLKTFRLLIADLCQQFGGGHPGGAIGMAAIGVALWRYIMRYAPHTPNFFNRDRFVLSNGHTCLFQYTFLHLTGYRDMTFDQLKSYHSDRVDALCPGHPEIEHEGIEVTTGPLGQGVANAVGLAMASKNLATTYNRPGYDVVSNHTWCMIGDACLQEGVALEAISLAGHWRLNNLTIIYDNNQITCDGSVDLTNTEDVNAKMRACGWDVIDVYDGCFDIAAIVQALDQARTATRKPTFINVRTVIGLGSKVEGQAAAHGAAFGIADVADMKRKCGFNPSDWKDRIPTSFPDKPTASRASSGLVFNPLAQTINSFIVGTADLSPSVNMIWPGKVDFQHPDLRTTCNINGNYSGRYIHYGVREHAMCAISNGLAAFAPNTFIPITSTFFMFYLYAAPAVRMGALQQLQVIHAATHDSIGMGEDGPTHQPIELAALYRAMPNLLYIRPGDSEETAGAWIAAIDAKTSSTIISTSRHNIPQLRQTRRDGVAQGAYILEEPSSPAAVTLIGVGAELSFALDVAKELEEKEGIVARVVSFPCQRLFERQNIEYKRGVLRRHEGIPAVVIEPYAPNGWERYADAAISLKQFGHSLPGKSAYKFFGFDVGVMARKVTDYLKRVKENEVIRGEFVDL